MTKKSSSKKPTPVQEIPPPQQKKPSPAPKQFGREIEEIFSSKKRKKPEQKKAQKPIGDPTVKPKKMKNENKRSKAIKEGGFADPPSRPRKKTKNGLAIYTEDELGIGKADAGVKLKLAASA